MAGSATFKNDKDAFLFSLKNNVQVPTTMNIKASKIGSAIYCNSGLGPTFGGGNANDLYIVNNPQSSNCSVSIGNAYDCPPGQSGTTFLTGNQNFIVSEIEVFEVFFEEE